MNIYWSFSVWLHRETFYVFIHVWIVSRAQYYTTCLCQMSLLCVSGCFAFSASISCRGLGIVYHTQLFKESNSVNTMRYKSSSWTESQSAQSSTRKKKLKQTPVQFPPVSLVRVKICEGSPSGTTNRLWKKDLSADEFWSKKAKGVIVGESEGGNWRPSGPTGVLDLNRFGVLYTVVAQKSVESNAHMEQFL